jgi:hypothetical protein
MLYLKDGTEVDLTIYIAAFVQGLLLDWYRHIQAYRVAKYRRGRDLHTEVDWTIVFSVMPSRRAQTGAKAAIMHFLAGFYPTRHWTATHGSTATDQCACSEVDTVAHRLAGCKAHKPCGPKWIREMEHIQALLKAEALPQVDRQVMYHARTGRRQGPIMSHLPCPFH